MLISMTGFGSAIGEMRGYRFRLEAYSLNHRFLEIKVKLPLVLNGLENEISNLAKSYFERGKIELSVRVEQEPDEIEFNWSRARARAYLEIIEQMKKELGIKEQSALELIINQRDVIMFEPERWGREAWKELKFLFETCFEDLAKSRAQEGERIGEELKERLARLSGFRQKLKEKSDRVLEEARARIKKRIEQLVGREWELEPGRLEQEVVILVSKSDISEELLRIDSNLQQFHLELERAGAKGKKLDFLVQELVREFNTISAKSQEANTSQITIEAKSELERIRQQLQNLE